MSLNDFEVVRKLGEGAFSSVFKVKRHGDGQDYAMKNIKMGSLSSKEKENAVNEIRFLASLNSPEIIGYKEAFYDEKTGNLHIIMEYCAGGDLLNKIRTLKKKNQYLDERVIWLYIIQMMKGIKCLHDLSIIHRDIKCANIMLTRDHKNLKIGDLNVSKVAKKGLLHTQTGTPYYASPEVWKDKPYDNKSDVWSLGCVIYELITLNPPFKAQDMEGLFKKVQKGQYDPLPSWYSQDLTDFLSLCLQVNPKMRLTTAELLETPFIQKRINIAQELNVKDYDPKFEQKQELLSTLRVGKNLNCLNNILPSSQYESTASTDFSNDFQSKGMGPTQQSDIEFINELRKQSQPPPQRSNGKQQYYTPHIVNKKGNNLYNNNHGIYSQQQIPSSNNIPSMNQIQSEMNLDAYEQLHDNKNGNKVSRSRSIENILQKRNPLNSKMSQQNLLGVGNHRYQQLRDQIPSLPPINESKKNLIRAAQDNILSTGKQINYNKNYDQGYIQRSYNQITPIGSSSNLGSSGTNSTNSSAQQRAANNILFGSQKMIM